MINRSSIIFYRSANAACILLFVAAFLTDRSFYPALRSILFLSAAVMLAAGAIAGYYAARCPFCRQRGVHPKLSAPNAGYCRHCGRQIEYGE